jgi:hypothetical protein
MPDPIPLATLQQWLVAAETAYQKLLTSGGIARIREGEKWIEYHQADADRLLAYIQQLQARVAAAAGQGSQTGGRRRAQRLLVG